jgi:hypothetical protein
VNAAVVRINFIHNYFASGVKWAGGLSNSGIQINAMDIIGEQALGGWEWASVSKTKIEQNFADRSSSLIRAYRRHGLRPTDFQGSVRPIPADTGVDFSENQFGGNVLFNQRATTSSGAAVTSSAYLPLFTNLAYAGDVSAIPGEVAPSNAQFHLIDNTFQRNELGHDFPGPDFGAGTVVSGVVKDGGQNQCTTPSAPTPFPLVCIN